MSLSRVLLGACFGLTTACSEATVAPQEENTGPTTLYHSMTVLKPATEDRMDCGWVLVRAEKIAQVGACGADMPAADAVVDMTGHTMTPGLIDGHAHMTSGYHSVAIEDGMPAIKIESEDEITQFAALMTLAFGVTTVRNPGSDPYASQRYDTALASGEWMGPEAFHAGSVIQPGPFKGNSFAMPMSDEEWAAEAQRQAELGMTYFKLYTGLNPEQLDKGVVAAKGAGLIPIAHLDQVSWTEAVDLGVKEIEHALPTSSFYLPEDQRAAFDASRMKGAQYYHNWFLNVDFDGPEIQHLFARMKEENTVVTLTMLVNFMVARANELDAMITPDAQTYFHPKSWAGTKNLMVVGASLWSPEDFETAAQGLPRVLEFAKRLDDAGIGLFIGTDGNGAGPLMGMEMDLHLEAGFSDWRVLWLATTGAAEKLGIGDRVGRIEAGYEADLVFYKEDPFENSQIYQTPSVVIVNGEEFKHEALVAQARQLLPVKE